MFLYGSSGECCISFFVSRCLNPLEAVLPGRTRLLFSWMVPSVRLLLGDTGI